MTGSRLEAIQFPDLTSVNAIGQIHGLCATVSTCASDAQRRRFGGRYAHEGIENFICIVLISI